MDDMALDLHVDLAYDDDMHELEHFAVSIVS